ncbi:GNAT family protein [Psychrobacillus sp. NEAU-3TGS]|uniref:GNAT family N-acetyltransferase n=1 Tax=Psychrobacillus sp. NEAU-3TGS TaxID=2995412 RepID=UPI002497B8BC|nr:GNAT family protein [Psychrobacillus sp. NEAU-3TGS]MDI2587937.1 GNAT family protein [Psychrobacillus sp. NEAU-3TGS]
MAYQFRIMTQEQAENIAFNWHYDGEYSFYDMESDKEDLEEFLNPETRGNSTYAVTFDCNLIGFFVVNKVADRIFDIGLGMSPNLTGKGQGLQFLKAGMDFVQSNYTVEKITLSVATFNQRAIKVYKRFGFIDIETFMQETNGCTFEFLSMEYNC